MFAGTALPGEHGRTVTAQDGSTEFHGAMPYRDFGGGGHFNQFVTNGILNPPNVYGDLIFTPMAMLYWDTNEWLPLLATEWAFMVSGDDGLASPEAGSATPGSTTAGTSSMGATVPSAAEGANPDSDMLQVRLREGVMWSDGNPVTSKDVVDTFDLLRLMNNTVWDYLDRVEAIDDLTINFHMAVPSTVVERYVIRQSPMSSAIYGEWADQARVLVENGATSDDPEWKQLVDQFNGFHPDHLIASGPYTIDVQSITNAQFDMPRNESSYWADRAKFDKIVNFNGETDTISAVVLSRDVDYATHGFAPATVTSMIENDIRVIYVPTYAGTGLRFNFNELVHFRDKRVRQALAHAINRDDVAVVSLAEAAAPPKYMAGMIDLHVEQWLSDEDAARLNPYEYDLDKAAALLEEAGWSRDGDSWMDPDGNPAEYEIMFPAELANHLATGQSVTEQLNAFGFQINPVSVSFTQAGTDVLEGRFQISTAGGGWGAGNPHPHYSYSQNFFTNNARSESDVQRGIDFPLVQETDVAGTVNIEELVLASAEGMDIEAQRQRVTKLAFVFNELLNLLPLYERLGNNPILEGERVAAWPADDDPIYVNSPYSDGYPTMLIYTGWLEPV